ncbi:phosphotransferase [Kitasatospora griseola]
MPVDRGWIGAVIDFGDLTGGDPATDLSVAWTLSAADGRTALRRAYGRADDATWARARGWASALSPVFLPHLADNPGMCGTVRSVLGQRAVTGGQDPGTSRRGRASRVDLRKWSR